jgi:serine/threonine protein kinase
MSKVYSNKALPPGTVLREWRLEEVLGVGGFGIVYKARGIYFNELVAIKEYFPSSISERQPDDTIVPVDSASEEVHALGLKKFVEEAKLLWNLSTPSRHPNIVSVRSLFEIHGSAYMVMDFEDGVSLSKLLKDGRRFNEASLTALVRPIAEGLERAHRVGVLHRDIKPPNILMGQDNRPVLIDFGSARFESGDATSTSVTFHTPPYAAIEQYVKTYQQGPWTDIYALGVVLYECVAGEKPADVLERLHGDADKKLSDGDWPGFSKPFLAAIDMAMAVRPDDRPRSISQWLELFERPDAGPAVIPTPTDVADDRTRIASFMTATEQIVPVAPPAMGFETKAEIRTDVPDTPSQAEFRIAGKAVRNKKTGTREAKPPAAPAAEPPQNPPAAAAAMAATAAAGTAAKAGKKSVGTYAGLAAAVIALGAGAWYMNGNASSQTAAAVEPLPTLAQEADQAGLPAAVPLGGEMQALADQARQAGNPKAVVDALATSATKVMALEADLGRLTGDTAVARQAEIDAAARPALLAFSTGLAADVNGKARRLRRSLPWTDARRRGAMAGASAEQRQIAATLLRHQQEIETARAGTEQAATGREALDSARQAVGAAQAYALALAEAQRAGPVAGGPLPQPVAEAKPRPQDTAGAATPAEPQVPDAAPAAGVSDATREEFDGVVETARGVAREVIRLGSRARPGSNASEAEQAGYRLRQQNAESAKNYQDYLRTLSRSMKGTKTEAEARQSVSKARQTLGYLNTMQAASQAALP